MTTVTMPPPVPAAAASAPLRPLTHARRVQVFGHFDFTPDPIAADPKKGTLADPEHIVIHGNWVSRNIVTVETPQLAHLGRKRVQFHKLAAPNLQAFLALAEHRRLLPLILTVNGTHVARYKRGHAGGDETDLSNHSWGTAIDFNRKWNELGEPAAKVGQPGSLLELAPIAAECGMVHGATFGRIDAMHFEVVKPMTLAELAALLATLV